MSRAVSWSGLVALSLVAAAPGTAGAQSRMLSPDCPLVTEQPCQTDLAGPALGLTLVSDRGGDELVESRSVHAVFGLEGPTVLRTDEAVMAQRPGREVETTGSTSPAPAKP